MVILKPICPASVASFKAVRLAALQDTPSAFGSTYAKEVLLSDAEWEQRVEKWNGQRSVCHLAWDADQPGGIPCGAPGGIPCGIAAGLLDPHDAAKAHLLSMWVAPSHRRAGVGRLLVNGIIDWARGQHARTLHLMVTSNNNAATRFYEQIGFTKTGHTEPYPNDSALVEYEMSLPLA